MLGQLLCSHFVWKLWPSPLRWLQVGKEEDALSGGDPPLLILDHFAHRIPRFLKALFCFWIKSHY
jgi:hypothetical protein